MSSAIPKNQTTNFRSRSTMSPPINNSLIGFLLINFRPKKQAEEILRGATKTFRGAANASPYPNPNLYRRWCIGASSTLFLIHVAQMKGRLLYFVEIVICLLSRSGGIPGHLVAASSSRFFLQLALASYAFKEGPFFTMAIPGIPKKPPPAKV